MLGKVFRHTHAQDRSRITPAYAGKRWSLLRCHAAKPDHPRLCGEKRFEMQCILHHTGSPPPMRGKGEVKTMGIPVFRITPAYAGKSAM